VLIGDSITQLWDVSAYINTDKFIINRGIGGDVSKYVLKRFDADVIQLAPQKVALMIGTNDISYTNDDLWWRTKGLPVENIISEYEENNIEHAFKLDKC